ncbi:type II toxin-antitoxin system RelE/ParE family toxin [Planctomicrobium piriforme]|uniref:Phage derived protein Gp49-like n=1 Tax=Planctomicrobium piriforme TaxID=1576369 RepID=A0A1I3G0Z4_9PLAN|nr:type II toxin-antitoxin system RelE/ParE family toxin [Planctomicrobium piriforme]SFI16831.1 Phage derived protein Gp49-like [Planctomicrobium piriforme]
MAKRRKVKLGVRKGGGPPPGYEWSVGILDFAAHEAAAVLGTSQYRHIAMQVKQLAAQGDPTHSAMVDVRQVEDLWEIRDKGGPLGNLNIRAFFCVDNSRRALIVLGLIVKKNDGKTPLGDKVRMRHRW